MVAWNRSSSARLRLGHIPMRLYQKGHSDCSIQTIVETTSCVSVCLAHFVNAFMSEYEKLEYAKQLHSTVGFEHIHNVLLWFHQIWETLECKSKSSIIPEPVVFPNTWLLTPTDRQSDYTCMRTIWLKIRQVFSVPHVCQYCYNTYETQLYQNCKHRCNVCFTVS